VVTVITPFTQEVPDAYAGQSAPVIGKSQCWVSGAARNKDNRRNGVPEMLVLGLILTLLGLLLNVSILYTIGIILLVVGAVLWILGAVGRPVGGRKVWF